MKPKILIAGATGATGPVATQILLEKGFPVRALVHQEDERSNKLKDQGVSDSLGTRRLDQLPTPGRRDAGNA